MNTMMLEYAKFTEGEQQEDDADKDPTLLCDPVNDPASCR